MGMLEAYTIGAWIGWIMVILMSLAMNTPLRSALWVSVHPLAATVILGITKLAYLITLTGGV